MLLRGNLFLHAIWVTSITTLQICNVWRRQPTENIWNDVTNRTCWFIMTVHKRKCIVSAVTFAAVPHTAYSPVLDPCKFLPRMKTWLWGCCFQDASKIQDELSTNLHVSLKCQFQQCFQQWQKHSIHWITQKRTISNWTITTNNKCKHTVNYQLRPGTLGQDLVHAKVEGFKWHASIKKNTSTLRSTWNDIHCNTTTCFKYRYSYTVFVELVLVSV